MKGKIHSAVFFIEIIVDISLFAIACAVILQAFVISVKKADEGRDLTWASVQAQSIAETIKSDPNSFSRDETNILYFGDDRKPSSEADSVYTAEIVVQDSPQKNGLLINYHILIRHIDENIFELNSGKYFPEGGAF